MKTPAPTNAPRDPHATQSSWLRAHLGKPVRLGLLSGKTLTGVLVTFDQYALEIRPQPAADSVMVWKHGTIYVAPAPSGSGGQGS